MARFFTTLTLLALSIELSQAQGTPPSVVSTTPVAQTAVSGQTTSTQKFDSLRRSFEQLSSDQQQKFLQNFHKWQDLSSDEKEVLRERERLRRQKQEASIAEAYQKSGLQLNEEQRVQFRKLYLQERRKLEEQLARETQEKRLAGNAAIIEQLKKEFSGARPVASSTTH